MKAIQLTALVLAALVVAAPAVSAKLWIDHVEDFFGYDQPDAKSPLADADLNSVTGLLARIEVTGIGQLTTLSFPEMDILLQEKPAIDQTWITTIPQTRNGAAVQLTTINHTRDMTIVLTPSMAILDGAEARPPQFKTDAPQFDPSAIFRMSTPDVSIQLPVALSKLEPAAVVGNATVTTTVERVVPNTKNLDLAFVLIDVDDLSRVNTLPPAFNATTMTEAATKTGIETMLDSLAVKGVDLNGVLSALAISVGNVGVVNLAQTAQAMADAGMVLRKVVDPQKQPSVEYYPGDKKLALINPDQFDRELVLLANVDDLATFSEDRLVALKDDTLPRATRALYQWKKPADDVSNPPPTPCITECMLEIEIPPEMGGISDALVLPTLADVRADDFVAKLQFKDRPEILPLMPQPYVDMSGVTSVKMAVAKLTEEVGPEGITMMLGAVKAPTPPAEYQKPMPQPNPPRMYALALDDALINFHRKDPDVHTPQVDTAQFLAGINDAQQKLKEFTVQFCTKCIGPVEYQQLLDQLGQMEFLAPRIAIPTVDLHPEDFLTVALGPAGELTMLADQDEFQTTLTEVYSTVRFRVIDDGSKRPVDNAVLTVNAYMPGYKGSTLQTYTMETNSLGYAAVKLLPNVAYNFTVEKKGFNSYFGAGASAGPGQTTGNDVRITPTSTFGKVVDGALSPLGGLLFAGVLVGGWVLYNKKRGGKKLSLARIFGRRRRGGRRRGR